MKVTVRISSREDVSEEITLQQRERLEEELRRRVGEHLGFGVEKVKSLCIVTDSSQAVLTVEIVFSVPPGFRVGTIDDMTNRIEAWLLHTSIVVIKDVTVRVTRS